MSQRQMPQRCPTSLSISDSSLSIIVSWHSLISAILRTTSLIPAPLNRSFLSSVF
uniref:Uncharacterized protein n=1 Tax=uncultured marine virus TaxID=186617 RepID=A0A0F7L8I9_9VIRU|nr:hypothetical protein [uncultured marine virus]